MSKFDENSRVKIPGIVHATRLGYDYISLKDSKLIIDNETNIFKNVFFESLKRINKDINDNDLEKLLSELKIQLDNEDLGKRFYNTLLYGYNGIKLIDFNNINNNTFNVVTELPYENGEDNFRPDIIMLINGMPLGFIEVKKPNNREGILAERNRINTRFKNRKFRRFVNITQVLVFSNNQEYNDDSVVPIEGAFYGTPSYNNVFFNCFREEDGSILDNILEKDEDKENFILKDTNYVSIKGTPEYSTNLNSKTPTNRILTSLFHKSRILNFIKYGIAYVEKTNKDGVVTIQKQIMRYQQFFATKSIESNLEEELKKGIIWHTQGSGKTALAYYNVKYLTDYYQKKNKIAKFYFIVDRLDLLKQACNEFMARGLTATKVNSREEFAKSIKEVGSVGKTGEYTINVVNIQKFSDESFTKESDYNVDVQRIYFLDEAHRSYKPSGSFLANMMNSDTTAIKIALTGTPIVSDAFNSRDIFGKYIHTYYYNKSIEDGYTLKLIREGIETSYRTKMNETIEDIKEKYGDIKESDIFDRPEYSKALTEYIVNDFKKFRVLFNDDSVGAMIVCDSSIQARNIFKDLKDYDLSNALILYDEDDKATREKEIDDFKKGKIDILVVYNMLLTGFDAPRLKKLYLGRVIRAHNLLQTLTRVNRPYKEFRYGYVVDFADIKDEFDHTNKVYFEELQKELGSEFDNYRSVFLSPEEIENAIDDIQNKLFIYDTDNLENFTSQVNELEKRELFSLKKIMEKYKELFNVIRAFNYEGQYKKISETLPIDRISKMIKEVDRRIDILNLTDSENMESSNILNIAFQDIEFNFKKISEEELTVADSYKKKLDEARNEFMLNIDKDDYRYIQLYNKFKSLFISRNLEDTTAEEMKDNMNDLDRLIDDVHKLNVMNNGYLTKYLGDEKYVKIHKRVLDRVHDFNEIKLNRILLGIKDNIDNMLLKNYSIIENEEFFKNSVTPKVIISFKENEQTVVVDEITFFTDIIVEQYLIERSMGLDD